MYCSDLVSWYPAKNMRSLYHSITHPGDGQSKTGHHNRSLHHIMPLRSVFVPETHEPTTPKLAVLPTDLFTPWICTTVSRYIYTYAFRQGRAGFSAALVISGPFWRVWLVWLMLVVAPWHVLRGVVAPFSLVFSYCSCCFPGISIVSIHYYIKFCACDVCFLFPSRLSGFHPSFARRCLCLRAMASNFQTPTRWTGTRHLPLI